MSDTRVKITKVLILDGHSKASAETVLALPRWCEIHVAGVGTDCLAFASRRVAQRLSQPSSPRALRAWLEARDRDECYDLIVASTEASLLTIKSQTLAPPLRTKAVIPDESSLDIALDKQRTLDLAQRLGIKVPRSSLVTSIDGLPAASYPVVIKPLHTKVAVQDKVLSFGVTICANAEQRLAAYRELLPLTAAVEQEYFSGHGLGVEALFEHGEPRWLFAHERIHELPVTGGPSTYRRSVDAPEPVTQAAIKLLTELHWHGVAMVEFKVADDGDYRLIEINPRLWGSLPMAVAAGVNFPLGLLRLALGESPGEQPRYRRGLYARDVAGDTQWFRLAWRHRRNPLLIRRLHPMDFIALLRPLIGAERWDLFRWREPELWWSLSKRRLDGLRVRVQRASAILTARANWRRLGSEWRNRRIKRVLVLCYGNICRSPVAGNLLQAALPDAEIVSAGLHEQSNRATPDAWAAVVGQTLDIDLRDHRSRSVDAGIIAWAELIIVMDAKNWRELHQRYPEAMERTVMLGITTDRRNRPAAEVPDPFSLEPSRMEPVAQLLKQCIDNLAKQRNAPQNTKRGTAA